MSDAPQSWKASNLGELCDIDPEILNSGTPGDYEFEYVDIASVEPNRISTHLSRERFNTAPSRARKRIRRGDVLMATVRPNLQAFARVERSGEMVASTGFAVLRAKPGISDAEFIKQVLFSTKVAGQIERMVAGSNYPAISVGNVKKLLVTAPPYEEQRRIAAVLSAMDEQIEKTEALIEKLRAQRSGVVQQSLLPLAEKAEVCELGALASFVTSGSRGWGKYYSDEGALFLRIGNLTREHPNLRLRDAVRVDIPNGGEGSRTRVQEGDILISITADLGAIGCIPAGLDEAYVNQHIALARILPGKALPRWIAHSLASPYGQRQFQAGSETGAKAGINLPAIRRLRTPCPPLDKQRLIVGALDAIDAAVEAENRYLRKLRLQKAGLMSDLLTGSVRT